MNDSLDTVRKINTHKPDEEYQDEGMKIYTDFKIIFTFLAGTGWLIWLLWTCLFEYDLLPIGESLFLYVFIWNVTLSLPSSETFNESLPNISSEIFLLLFVCIRSLLRVLILFFPTFIFLVQKAGSIWGYAICIWFVWGIQLMLSDWGVMIKLLENIGWSVPYKQKMDFSSDGGTTNLILYPVLIGMGSYVEKLKRLTVLLIVSCALPLFFAYCSITTSYPMDKPTFNLTSDDYKELTEVYRQTTGKKFIYKEPNDFINQILHKRS